MLMYHKNFHFKQISDKPNDVIFLKSPKTWFWTIFGHFCLMGIFSKKSGSVTQNYIWALNTMLSFRSRVMRMCHFWIQNARFAPNNLINFFLENYWYHSHLPINPFHCAKFKKLVTGDPELWESAIFWPKLAHFYKWDFFQKTCYWALLLSLIDSYLQAKNQSQTIVY